MSVAWLMLFGGFVLVVAGVKNVSVLEALRGNFDVAKSPNAIVAKQATTATTAAATP